MSEVSGTHTGICLFSDNQVSLSDEAHNDIQE